MPSRFFKLDRSHWTVNVFASLKFGVGTGVFYSAVPYAVRFVLIPKTIDREFIYDRCSAGFVNMVLFGLMYYIVLILYDLHFERDPDEKLSSGSVVDDNSVDCGGGDDGRR